MGRRAMPKNADRLYLRRRGEVWHLKYPIPSELQPLYQSKNGKPTRHKERSLGTRDLREANREKHRYITLWVAEFNAKRRQAAGKLSAQIDETAEWRTSLPEATSAEDEDLIRSLAADRAMEVAKVPGYGEYEEPPAELANAGAWYKLATAKATLREAWKQWVE